MVRSALLAASACAAVCAVSITNPSFAQSFRGSPCTIDCSGHEAGYEWAEDNNITNASDCDSNSNSFNEGCEAYVEDNGDTGDSDAAGEE